MPKRAEKPEAVKEPVAKNASKTEKKVVEKFPTIEKAKKFLEKVRKGLSAELFDVREVEAGRAGEQKVKIAFLNFCKTPKGDGHEEMTKEEDAYNVECIKDVLFYYHTGTAGDNDSAVVLQVITPAEEGGFHLLAYQEVSDK